MNFQHKSGILLHITSLPARYGIGDLGPEAYRFLDFLKASCTRWWQVLPLGPTGYGDSPYQSYSSFAGNWLLINPDRLVEQGLLVEEHLRDAPHFPTTRVNFPLVIDWKRNLLQVAFMRLKSLPGLEKEFQEFRAQQAEWLNDFSLFMAIKARYNQRPWPSWAAPLRDRKRKALAQVISDSAATVAYFAFQQFLFFQQWNELRTRMAALNIGLIGDLPIYVAHDSADVWCHRELFELNEKGRALRMAGVPPDMFSETGQLWGNPLYRWDAHKREGYAWWLARLRTALAMVDVIRLDHFRGFADFYAVPGRAKTAENGTWELGPGADFFKVVRKEFGDLPLIAEDLGGERSPLVVKLRDRFGLPGMKVFQGGFGDDLYDPFLPHNYPENCVAYTGTHDSDTALGWFRHARKAEREFCIRYLKSDGRHLVRDMLKKLWSSRASLTVAPLQDFLELGSSARMNYPSTLMGNWVWRAKKSQLNSKLVQRIADLNKKFHRAA